MEVQRGHGPEQISPKELKSQALDASRQNIAFPAALAEKIEASEDETSHRIEIITLAQAAGGALASSFQDNANKLIGYVGAVLSELRGYLKIN